LPPRTPPPARPAQCHNPRPVARKTAEPASVARLREHAALMEILTQVSQAALESGSLEERLHRIANFLYDRLPVAIASILLLDSTGGRFVSETDSGDLPLDFPDDWP